ncbi:unnamed protein product [Cylindrotheca closterium]|uniref:HMG box domain-containing protein n=1 Tax=Cylindrotheca closterium TaxID=2856 RepID=A0AAD2G1J5_9STRA|nr:unnamed protein product [Cylindrotheca closterium]
MPNDENAKENSNNHAFCVPAGYAKSEWFLDTQDLKPLEYEQKGGRYYGGCFKLYQPAVLEALAEKKYGKNRLANFRQEREDKIQRKRDRELKNQEEERKQQKRELEQKRQQKLLRKKEKDRPCKAVCAGEHYRRLHRPAFRKENPTGSGYAFEKAIDKMINAQYRSLSAEERRTWTAKAKADKVRYEKEYAAWDKKWNSQG